MAPPNPAPNFWAGYPTGSVLHCEYISSRIISIGLNPSPFKLTVIQVYAATSDHTDEEIEDFYLTLNKTIQNTPRKDVLIVLGDWNAKIGTNAHENWPAVAGKFGLDGTNVRGARLLEFAEMNDFVIANTLHPHKESRRYTWTCPDGYTRNQIDYILIQRKFKSSVIPSKTRSYPGADVGNDHNLVTMNLKFKLRRIRKQKSQRIKYNLDKLQYPETRSEFSAKIGAKFAPLLLLDNVEEITTGFTEAMNETAAEVLGKKRNTRKPWIDDRLAQRCEERQKLKASRYHSEDSRVKYGEANNRVKAEIRRAKEEWTNDHCHEIHDGFETNNTQKSFQSSRELTTPKSNRISTIKDKNGKVVTSKEDVEKHWTEYAK